MGMGACRQGIDSLVLKCIMCSGKGKSRLAGRKGLLGREAVDEVGREAEVNRKGLSHHSRQRVHRAASRSGGGLNGAHWGENYPGSWGSCAEEGETGGGRTVEDFVIVQVRSDCGRS